MKPFSMKWLTVPVTCSLALLVNACSQSPSLTLPALASSNNKAVGTIIWRDLATTAPDKVQPFYHNVFGWNFESVNNDYSLITYQGQPIAGMAKMPSNSSTNYWLPVISTNNVDNTLSQSKLAGGKTLIKKTTLKGRGELAVIQDPQGAVFSILNTFTGDPAPLAKQDGNWIWQEIWTDNISQSQSFYQKLGDFKSTDKTMLGHSYSYLAINDQPAFGFVKKPNAEVPTTWVNYIKVSDINATVEKIELNGGHVLMAPTKEVRNGTVAIIRDPAGAGFVIQEMK
ncbi:VOC family protein [Vibrio rumoiensis]|uniref:VOC family protein n=1 Tax=Vibrio rumoiensis TaxID=76258 RepID=UPI000B5D02E9|nr:VOC family protein [Vibrio rumoiensis]